MIEASAPTDQAKRWPQQESRIQMLNAEPLRDAAEMLLNGEGPDIEAGMDERYADWLLNLADRYEAGEI